MKQSLKGVCVGAGYFSHYQYEAWNRIPEVEITAVCNRSLDRANEISRQYDIPNVYGIEDFEKMLQLEKPDFVDIITPPETHLALCRAAVAAEVHVVCQKPLAPTYAETLELARVARAGKRRFMVHENWRWQPWYREIKSLLNQGVLGDFFHCLVRTRMGDGWGKEAYLARQPFFRECPRLFLFETGVHFLDTFRFLFGEISSIYAQTARLNPVIQGEDSAVVMCKFEGGGSAVLDANRYNESETLNPRYTFGRVRIDGSQGHLELLPNGHIRLKPLGKPATDHAYKHSRHGFAGDCVYEVQRHFVDALLNDRPFESEVTDYLESVRLVEVAYASAARNEVIAVKRA